MQRVTCPSWLAAVAAAVVAASQVGPTSAAAGQAGVTPVAATDISGTPIAAGQIGPTVATGSGSIRGRATADGGAAFRGIPFAQPPLGDLRWREPQPVVSWPGVRDAGEPGPPCAQNSSGWNEKESIASREDCLYLDVRTPAWPPTTRKPVMVWIHGGANTGGAGASDPLYEGSRLVSRGVVLVVVEYRLGVFGFLAHPDLTRESPHHASGNYALLDQVAALRWVHENIATFGGDPNSVTLFGQSAGASNLSALMTSPLARGLFHRAIAESGAAGRPPSLAQAEEAGTRLAAKLSAPSGDALSFLRGLSTAALLAAAPGGASPNVDGWLLPASPAASFAAGTQHAIPYIVGSNAIEMSGQRTPDELRSAITARYDRLAPRALALYGLAEPGAADRTDPLYGSPNDQWTTDTGIRCPGVQLALQHSAVSPATWMYEFGRAIPPKPTVVHSSELPYVFGNLYATGSQAGQYTDVDRQLSDTIQIYWTNFAKTGDPNGPGLPAWPKFDSSSRGYVEFGANGQTVAKRQQRGAFCDVFIERGTK
jgi:para-nitrobenzyl esterase